MSNVIAGEAQEDRAGGGRLSRTRALRRPGRSIALPDHTSSSCTTTTRTSPTRSALVQFMGGQLLAEASYPVGGESDEVRGGDGVGWVNEDALCDAWESVRANRGLTSPRTSARRVLTA